MALEEYRKKRDFGLTSEPSDGFIANWEPNFVVQEHEASHHHFDLRLEMPADFLDKFEESKEQVVLKSWAVPKEIPMEKGIKRLAIQVEDHPVTYLDFEGSIPKGQYGAGTVKIWDKGSYDVISHSPQSFKVRLEGRRFCGDYAFVKTAGPVRNQWLLFRT